ncbi:MAG: type II secretion system major pseudopilin GspG [Tepidisphaera sp.]|jgi:general secretion pathway protein G
MKNWKRNGAGRAFTIIEVIVIIVIIGVIAAVVAPRLISRIGQSKTAMAKSNAAALASAMNTYMADCGTPPQGSTIEILMDRPSDVTEDKWKGPYVQNRDMLLDPWGKKFELRVPGEKNVDFDIVSFGLDGQPGGEGENADTVAP